MARIGYHASHEQFAPSELLRLVQRAGAAGFDCAKCSDHFHPWSDAQGQSGFAWAWLGAVMQATRLPLGVISAPGWRYHPAVLAQAAATLTEMFAGRLWLALGSGQHLNEGITGVVWPEKGERNARLQECAEVIRALLAGETVTHRGRVTVIEAKLYTRPAQPPPLLGAAVTEETARMVGGWADGLLTVSAASDKLRRVIDAFREGGGDGKRIVVQVGLSWAASEEQAVQEAHAQWRYAALGGEVNWSLRTPAQFTTATRHVQPEDMRESLLISADLGRHHGWLAEIIELGVHEIHLHHVGRNQAEFIDNFGRHVLSQFRDTH